MADPSIPPTPPSGPRPSFSDMEPDGSQLCDACRERPATMSWGDAMAVSHGGGEWRCDVCALTERVAYARERAAALPELERQLAEALRAAETDDTKPDRLPNRCPLPARALQIDDSPRPPAPAPDPSQNPRAQRDTALLAVRQLMQDHVVPLLEHPGKSEIGSVGYRAEAAVELYEAQLRALGNKAWRRRVIAELQEIDEP